MPNSRCALHGLAFLIRGLCACFASYSRFMRLLQAALDTCLDSPSSATLSVHGLRFAVCAPSSCGCVWVVPDTLEGSGVLSQVSNRLTASPLPP